MSCEALFRNVFWMVFLTVVYWLLLNLDTATVWCREMLVACQEWVRYLWMVQQEEEGG